MPPNAQTQHLTIALVTPGYGYTVGTGVQNVAPAEIRLEGKRVGTIYIIVTDKVTVAGVCIGAGVQDPAPAEI
jgi:hypothetical protein